MPGCCSPQTALSSDNVHLLHPQAFEKTGLKSPPIAPPVAGGRTDATTSGRANSAWQTTAAEQRRQMEWQAINLPHNSSHLFARLPFGDAVRLAVLAGTGQMSWAEINAALNAKIKLAIAGKRSGQEDRSPDHHDTWRDATRSAEDEIWSRYHAKCDTVFANDAAEVPTDPWSREQLRARERILNRLRSERDRALAALNRRVGTQSPCVTSFRFERAQLTIAERGGLRKLKASGFVVSQSMSDAIRDLATPLAGSA